MLNAEMVGEEKGSEGTTEGEVKQRNRVSALSGLRDSNSSSSSYMVPVLICSISVPLFIVSPISSASSSSVG